MIIKYFIFMRILVNFVKHYLCDEEITYDRMIQSLFGGAKLVHKLNITMFYQ